MAKRRELRSGQDAFLEELESSQEYLRHLQAQGDPLQLVLRWHMLTEVRLVKLIAAALPEPNAIDLYSTASYGAKLKLARALGLLLEDQDKPYLALNTLRNKFAHNLTARLTNEDVEKVYVAMRANPWHRRFVEGRDNKRNIIARLALALIAMDVALKDRAMRVAEVRPQVMKYRGLLLQQFAKSRG